MKKTGLLLGVIFCLSIAAYGGKSPGSEPSPNALMAANSTAAATSQNLQGTPPSKVAPFQPYPRLLPLQLVTPPTAQAGVPLIGVNVSLKNPGAPAPNARLRLIIHETNHSHAAGQHALSPDNVKVEVLESGVWKPVNLGMVARGVLGVIGPEGVTAHRERYHRGGFAIPTGMNKTWQLRVTFGLPGTYSLVTAVSPDNGSTHLAQPAHSIIEVQ